MGDDPSTEAKMELLWREYEKRQAVPPPPPPPPSPPVTSSGGLLGVPDRLIVIVLIAANAIGLGPDAIQSMLNLLTKAAGK